MNLLDRVRTNVEKKKKKNYVFIYVYVLLGDGVQFSLKVCHVKKIPPRVLTPALFLFNIVTAI